LVLNILQWYHNKNSAISFDGFAVLFLFANKTKKDSADVYQNIQTYSKKKINLQNFTPCYFKSNNSRTKKQVVKLQQRANVEGKVIRNISIVTLDPLAILILILR
jgi:hypothetical protein